MANREFLQLAHTYKQTKHGIGGWFVSEKLDGQRCFWDGGITRGMIKSQVPWANTLKDSRYKDTQYATGLWSRYGNIIHAPNSWLDKLPRIPLDGELYIPSHRQDLMSIIKKLEPDEEAWEKVLYYVFDLPPYEQVFRDGRINNPNFQKTFSRILVWLDDRISESIDIDYIPSISTPFESKVYLMQKMLTGNVAIYHNQVRLPFQTDKAIEMLAMIMDDVLKHGGEGLIIKAPHDRWSPKRVQTVLKYKLTDDAEGTVVGYITGRETDKGSKLLGLMGALILKLDNGSRLELSGFTDQERELIGINGMNNASAILWACANPGQECPDWIEAKHFPEGSRVTFKYRGLSKDGIPQEARYWRRRVDL